MKDYFKCKEGCTGCCPGGYYLNGHSKEANGKHIAFLATIGDLYRSYKFNNREGKKFSEIFNEQFRLIVHKALDRELTGIEKELKESGLVTFLLLHKPGTFSIVSSPKEPCYNLNGHGCNAHNSIVKYITCILEPQDDLHYYQTDGMEHIQRWKELFPCVMEKSVNPMELNKIKNLRHIQEREEQITAKIFPYVKIDGLDENIGALPLEVFNEDDGKKEKLEEGIIKTITSFDEKKNRVWEEEIMESTKRYAEIIGFKIN